MKKKRTLEEKALIISFCIVMLIIFAIGYILTPKVGDPDYVPPAEGSHTQTVTEYISDFC